MLQILRDVKAAIFAPETLAIWAFVSFMLTLTGPFGTYETMTFGQRLIYWPGLLALTFVIGYALLYASQLWTPTWPFWLVEFWRISVFALIFTPILRLATLTMVPDEPIEQVPVPVLFALVAAIGFAASMLRHIYVHLDGRNRVQPDQNRFYRRLPDGVTAPILRLSVDDHYVLAHLTDGTVHRILIRFVDAVGEMDQTAGLSVHRSHWVVSAFILDVVRIKGREFVSLLNGEKIPVGPKYRAGLIAAGWLPCPALIGRNHETAPSSENGEQSFAKQGA